MRWTESQRRMAWGAAAGLAGLLANLAVVDLLPTVHVLFGPLFSIAAAVLLGSGGGALAAGVAASRTWVLWEHPWGWMLSVAEAAVVGRLARRLPPVVAVAVFWLTLGPPLLVGSYVLLAHIPLRLTLVMGVKQAVNSLLAALVVQVVLLVPTVRRRVRARLPPPMADVPVSTAMSSVLALGAILPLVTVVAVEGRSRFEEALAAARRENSETARVVVEQVAETVAHARLGAERLAVELAAAAERDGTLPGRETLEGELHRLRSYSPELASAYVTDERFRAVAFDPAVGVDGNTNVGVDFSDRPYLQALRDGATVDVSSAYVGRRTGILLAAVAAPVRARGGLRGAVVTALDLNRLTAYARERILPEQRVVVLDSTLSVLIDTQGPENALSSLAGTPLGAAVRDATIGSTGRYTPEPGRVWAVRARSERDFSVRGVPGTGWRVVVEQPTTRVQAQVEAAYLGFLYVMGVALALTALSAIPLSRILVLPIRGVSLAADRLASGDRAARSPEATRDAPLELRELAHDFDHMADQLAGQLDAIERASHEKDAFLSVASHELRTPLTALKVQVEILRRRVGEQHRERLDALDRQLDRVARLVSQLLDAARLGTGQLPLDPTPCDLAAIARRVAEAHVLASSAHTLVLDLTPAVGDWDELRIEQVLHNLVSNAVKYSPSGGPIEVRVRPLPDGMVELTVADRGIGLSQADVRGLFERFGRGSSAEVEAITGLGVGLYVSREIVQRHGGTIALQPRPGGGAIATVRLPGARPVAAAGTQTG